jgi:hypothetical protein
LLPVGSFAKLRVSTARASVSAWLVVLPRMSEFAAARAAASAAFWRKRFSE